MTSEKKETKEKEIERKRLFFDKDEKYCIEFNLDEKTTCQKIYNENKEEITNMIKILNKNLPKNFDLDNELELDNYFFCLIQPKIPQEKGAEKKIVTPTIDLKLKLYENIYNIYSSNPNSIICFLAKNKAKLNLRKNARSLFVLEKDIYEDTEDSKLKDNTVKENIEEEILFKYTVFFYESKNKNFIKKDIVIDFEKITITKENKYININAIKKFNYFIHDSDEFKKLNIKADKMYGYIIIEINEKESYLIAHKKEYYYKKLLYSIKCAINNNEISFLDVQIDNNIYSAKSGLFAIYHLIIDNCFLLKEILSNEEKRKIFIDIFPQKKVGEIVDKIIEYKSLNKKELYLESWTNFKQILAYLEPYKDESKNQTNELFNVLKKVNINKYKEVLKESNNTLQNIMMNMKKGNVDNPNNNLQNNINNALKELLKDNLFDELFYYLYNLYLLPYFEEINKTLKEGESSQNKSILRKKFQLLLALYYFKFFELKFNYLGDKDDIRTASLFYQKK